MAGASSVRLTNDPEPQQTLNPLPAPAGIHRGSWNRYRDHVDRRNVEEYDPGVR